MEKQKITIRTKKAGKFIERNAIITGWIDNNGRQFCTAIVGNINYDIVDRDFYGPIWEANGKV